MKYPAWRLKRSLSLVILLAVALRSATALAGDSSYRELQLQRLRLASAYSEALGKELDRSMNNDRCASELEGAIYPRLVSRIGPAVDNFGLRNYSETPKALATYLASGCPAGIIQTFWPKVEAAAMKIDKLELR